MIEEKENIMIDVEYKTREVLCNKEAFKAIMDNDIDEPKIYINRWRVLKQNN